MALTEDTKKIDLEKILDQAIKKIGGIKEKDICHYLPGSEGGYMHHFTLRKLKHADPTQLISLLQKFIINSNSPRKLQPKQRAPRGSRKRGDLISFTRSDIEKILEIAIKAGDKDIVARFSPKRTLPSLKRELIRSIRENRIKQDLWSAYCEAVGSAN